MNNQDFSKTFLEYILPGQHVLDLGAGEGRFAEMFIERGAKVTAVDSRPTILKNAMITPKRMKIEEFCTTESYERYDRIFARNIIQFLDKNWVYETLIPWMEEHSNERGIIAIEAFFQNPEPPFDHPMRSLYTLKELIRHFITWNELHAREYSYLGLDMSGQARKFYISSLIVQKAQ